MESDLCDDVMLKAADAERALPQKHIIIKTAPSQIYGQTEKIGNKLIDKLILFYVNYCDD